MKLETLRLRQFRNIEELELTADEGVNVLYGQNAQGKTNLLEAIWLMSTARSFRTSRDADLIRAGEQEARVDCTFFSQRRSQQASLKIGTKREYTLNEISLKSPSRLAEQFLTVVFSPEDVGLIKGEPAMRRKFLDWAVGQIMPKYLRYQIDYQKILSQRNAALKTLSYSRRGEEMLDVWDGYLAKYGAAIIKGRLKFLARLEQAAREIYAGIAREKETFSISYLNAMQQEVNALSSEEIAALFGKQLTESREEDIRQGYTSIGPHRDDLSVLLDQNPARIFASQGQQRSCSLALKLAQSQLVCEITGIKPIILLDDVLSELDSYRRNFVLNHIEDRQIFITCCDRQSVARQLGGKSFLIREGQVVKTAQLQGKKKQTEQP